MVMAINEMYVEGKRLLLMHELNILAERHDGINNFTNLLDRISKADENELNEIGQKMFEEKEIIDNARNVVNIEGDLTDTCCTIKDGQIDFPNYCNALGNILFDENTTFSPIYPSRAANKNSYFLPLFIFSTKNTIDIAQIGSDEREVPFLCVAISLEKVRIINAPNKDGLPNTICDQIDKVGRYYNGLHPDLVDLDQTTLDKSNQTIEESTKEMNPEKKRQIINAALFFVSALGTCTSLMIFKPDIFSGIGIVFPNLPNWGTGLVGTASILITAFSFVSALLRSVLKNSYQNKLYENLQKDQSIGQNNVAEKIWYWVRGAHPNPNPNLDNSWKNPDRYAIDYDDI
jgi:hypothetical protein